jgi:NAD-dependent DNA ligase
MAKKIKAEIDKTRVLELHMFLGALGVPKLGRRVAKKLVDADFDMVETYMMDDYFDGDEIPGLGPKVAQAINAGLKEVRPLMERLLEVVEIGEHDKEDKDMDGPTVVFTGKMTCTRPQMEEHARKAGWTPMPRLTKEVQVLVQADPSSRSTKTKKAEAYGAEIISEDDFWERIK